MPDDNALESSIDKIALNHIDTRHHICFLQSSGYGKTRRCLELLKRRKGVYFLCDQILGGLAVNDKFSDLLKIDQNNVAEVQRVVKTCVAQIYNIVESADSAVGLFNEQFADNCYNQNFMKDIDLLNDATTRSRENIGTNQAEMFLIIFDEAHELGERLMAELKLALDDHNLIGIFLSTLGNLDEMIPQKRSSRTTMMTSAPPVTFLNTFDLYSDEEKFFLGRPLWKNWFLQTRKSKEELVHFAVTKLCGGGNDHLNHAALSLFMCRFGGLNPVDYFQATLFVNNCMATYVKLEVGYDDQDNRSVTCLVTYPSEPILVEASAFLTSSFNKNDNPMNREDLLTSVKTSINSKSIVKVHKGDVGELMASALICFTLDSLREKLKKDLNYQCGFMSTDIEVSVFLLSLFPGIIDNVGLLSLVEGYVVNVTHFTRLPFTPKGNKFLEINKLRGAAIFTKENSASVDILFSFFKSSSSSSSTSSKLIHCRVQVKNVSRKITNFEATQMLEAMTDKCLPHEDTTEYVASDVSVNILINMGTGSLDPFSKSYEEGPITRSRKKQTATKYILIALNLEHGKCFEDLEESMLNSVKDIAKCDQLVQEDDEQAIRQSVGRMYYETRS